MAAGTGAATSTHSVVLKAQTSWTSNAIAKTHHHSHPSSNMVSFMFKKIS
jgi:hypothetical protein